MKKWMFGLLVILLSFGNTLFAKDTPQTEWQPRGYQKYVVTVKEIYDDHRILVEDGEKFQLILLPTKDKVMDLKAGKYVEPKEYEVGQKCIIFLRNDTPFLQSFPPQTTPDLIALYPGTNYSIDMDYYGQDGLGVYERLRINGIKGTEIVNSEKKDIQEEDLHHKELIVLYTTSTRSIPPQTIPKKIWMVEKKERADLELSETLLQEFAISEGEKTYYPLRKTLEKLGVQVHWDKAKAEIELQGDGKTIKILPSTKSVNWGEETSNLNSFHIVQGVSFVNDHDIKDLWDHLKD